MKREPKRKKPSAKERARMLTPELSEALKWEMYRTVYEASFFEMLNRYHLPKELRCQLLGPDITDEFADSTLLAFAALRAIPSFRGATGAHPLVEVPTDSGLKLGGGRDCFATVAIEGEPAAHLEVYVDREPSGEMSLRVDVVPGSCQKSESGQAR